MNICEVLESHLCDNERVTVNGFLRVTVDGKCFLRDVQMNATDQTLGIEHAGLCERLLDVIPCLVGGQFLYDDSAAVEGIVRRDDNGAVLVRVSKVIVERKGQQFEVICCWQSSNVAPGDLRAPPSISVS